jgi:hypothetical protein
MSRGLRRLAWKGFSFGLLLLTLCLSILPQGGRAEPPTGTRIDPNVNQPPAWQMSDAVLRDHLVEVYAACLVRMHPRMAEAMLAQPYLSPAQSRLVAEISDDNCLGPNEATLRYQPASLIGRLAQILVLEHFARADVARFAGLSDDAADRLGLAPRNDAEDMASCILRRDPQAVRALIDTPWGSPEEAAAIHGLMPHLGPCAPAGATLALNNAAVRLMLATGLYRALSIVSAAPVRR